jgi:hypothetical protein
MTKRFLFVCGGAGQELTLQQFSNQARIIQLDQPSEITVAKDSSNLYNCIPNRKDYQTWNRDVLQQNIDLRLKVLQNIALLRDWNSIFHSNMLNVYKNYNEYKSKNQERNAEVNAFLSQHGTSEQLSRTVISLLAEIHHVISQFGELRQGVFDIPVFLMRAEKSLEKEVALTRIVLRNLYGSVLGGGMGSMPIMESSPFVAAQFFDRADTIVEFIETLNRVHTRQDDVADETIDVTVISYMSCAMGQGITQHVAQQAGRYFVKNVPDGLIRIQKIRFGAWSFNSSSAHWSNSKHTNTAMAVLHDAGFAYRQRTRMQGGSDASDVDESNRIDYQYIYLEAPDFGQNNALRQRYIAHASKGVMHPEVQQALQKMYNNSGPLDWFRGVFVRAGTWENEIDSQTVYREALEALRTKIALLVTPNYQPLTGQLRSRMQPNADLLNWHVAQLVELKEPNKTKSKLSTLNVGRYDRDSVAEYVRSQDFMTKWHKMSAFLEDYVGIADKLGFTFDIWIGPIDPRGALTPVTFANQIAPKHSAEYLHNVTRAHEVRSIALQLLAGSEAEPGIIARMFAQWNSMVPGMFDGNKTVDAKVRGGIKAFVETYMLVRTLLSIIEKSDSLISDVRDWLAVLVDFIRRQQEMMPQNTNERLTLSAELTEIHDAKTWLAILQESLVGNLQSQFVVNNFKSGVLRGASGVTLAGLRHVLSLPATAATEEVVTAVNVRAGRIFNNGVFEEAPWWQGQQFDLGVEGQFDFAYRIFPPMAEADRTTLLAANKAYAQTHGSAPEYIFESQPSVSLAVLSVECIRPHGSLVTQLITPLLPRIRIQDTDRGESGYIQRLAFSSIGEPIYMTDALHEQITGGKVDLRTYFVTVGPDEVVD